MQKEIVDYIEEYKPYITYIVKRRKFLERYWEDMIQLIIIELIKMYTKKYTYTDFDWVIRSVIRRKAIVWSAYYAKRDENLYFPNQMKVKENIGVINRGADHDQDSLEGCQTCITRSFEVFEKFEREKKIVEFIRDIQYKLINSSYVPIFSDWDREYVEVVLELYDLESEISRQDLIECMGYDDTNVAEFNSKLLSFRNKINNNFGDEYKELL